jgi:hypothetical protein
MRKCLALTAAALLLLTAELPAATPFMADFTGADGTTALHAQLINPNGVEAGGEFSIQTNAVSNAVDGFGHAPFGWAGRAYVRTVDTDYITANFTATILVTISNHPFDQTFSGWFGIGTATPNPGWYSTPNLGIDIELYPTGGYGGLARMRRVDLLDDGSVEENAYGSSSIGNGTHLLSISKSGNSLTLDVDKDNNSSIDFSSGAIDLTDPANAFLDATNSLIFFGGPSNYAWDDLNIVVTPPLHPGDFDTDGDVDGTDFVAWQSNFPKASGALLSEGDADGDGDVDGADFVVWQTNFPFPAGPGTSPVPEPASIILSLLGGIVALARHRVFRRNSGKNDSAAVRGV